MRDDTDKLTAELPTLPAYTYPDHPMRDNRARRASEIGYRGPKERARCENCRHMVETVFNPDSIAERISLNCSLGKFPVQRGGICIRYCADK